MVTRLQVIAINPPGFPGCRIAIAAARAGFTGVVSLETWQPQVAEPLLIDLAKAGVPYTLALPVLDDRAKVAIAGARQRGLEGVILSARKPARLADDVAWLRTQSLTVYAEACSAAEIAASIAADVDRIVIKGNEAAGRVGEQSAFILLQAAIAATPKPIYVRGGIGARTSAACLAAGARGVVLDWQLALTSESSVPTNVRNAIASFDGCETRVVGEELGARYRVYWRRDKSGIAAIEELENHSKQQGSAQTERFIDEWHDAIMLRTAEADSDKALLLVGQDACLAAHFSRRYTSVGEVCREIERAAGRSTRLAMHQQALAPDSSLARRHGTRFPIVQGPMTRVSDKAEFALEVAEAGGLPFLALALMRGAEVSSLLQQTKQLLNHRPWGVGLLGFVEQDLLAEQQRAVLEYRPRFVIIAGGRVDQLQAFEQQGIATYLHVPSPGLLRMFLDEGARAFVFEGRECGGHVGPRSSFVLWESMIEVLLEHLADKRVAGVDLRILFAGGIHDAISASMVMAIAAVLVERGVSVGVVLGTAYLFTAEAVKAGAIVEGFQRVALDCVDTSLLESGVGHITRAATTAFTRVFQQEKRNLIKAGHSREHIHSTLEQLNLGRLRIAAKGLARQQGIVRAQFPESKGSLVSLSPEDQSAQGMYMIGQVAALRSKVVGIEDLHRSVSSDSSTWLARQLGARAESAPPWKRSAIDTEPKSAVAIVGMSCLLPRAKDIHSYWENILNKVVALEEVPAELWDWRLFYEERPGVKNRFYSKWGGFIDSILFDPVKYGMPPKSVPSIEPLQLLFLEVVDRALTDAGYDVRPFPRQSTSVIVGGGGADAANGYGVKALLPYFMHMAGKSRPQIDGLLDELDSVLPQWTEDSFPGMLANVVAGRIANRFNFGGSNYAVDSACASSLTALCLGVNELRSFSSDMVVVGAADTATSPSSFFCFSETHALSPTGRSRPLDESADGIVISEGIAAVILKRLEDAERDGDRIYAVIKGFGLSSDGRQKSLTAPNPEGQLLALKRAYAQAGVAPTSVELIEGHCTGTVAGDAAEIQSLSAAFTGAGAPPQSVALGSVKSLIGHTKSAAGLAGLIKATLALHHRVLPPTAEVAQPNARIQGTPLYVNSEARPWLSRKGKRRAAVSAFGFGGTNAHVVLEEYPDDQQLPSSGLRNWPAELFVWRAVSVAALRESLQVLADALSSHGSPNLRELAAAVCAQSESIEAEHTLAIVANSVDGLSKQLHTSSRLLSQSPKQFENPLGIYYAHGPVGRKVKVAFLFPGQGSQRLNMLRDLVLYYPDSTLSWQQADSALSHVLETPLSDCVYAIPSFGPEEMARKAAILNDTRVAQPALGAADMLMYRILSDLGVRPDVVCGHSYGEYVALCAAEAIEYADLIRLSHARGRAVADAVAVVDGRMLALFCGLERVLRLIEHNPEVVAANFNTPSQTIISGTRRGIESLQEKCAAENVLAKEIPVSAPFHSPWVSGAREPLERELRAVAIRPPRLPVYSNTSAAPHCDDPERIRERLVDHLVQPVRFSESLLALERDGVGLFVEVGPGETLTSFAKQTLGEDGKTIVSLDQRGRHGLEALLRGLAKIATTGIRFNTAKLFANRVEPGCSTKIVLQGTKQQQPTATSWLVNGRKAVQAAVTAGQERSTHARAGAASDSYIGSSKMTYPDSPREARKVATDSAHRAAERGSVPPAVDVRASNPDSIAATSDVDAVMLGYQRLMTKLIEAEAEIMHAYLARGSALPHSRRGDFAPDIEDREGRRVPVPTTAHSRFEGPPGGASVADEANIPAGVQPEMAATSAASKIARLDSDGIGAVLVSIVTELTGYPKDMLGLQLDLEADLGVDSIKRVEIVGELQRRLAIAGAQASRTGIKELVSCRTLSEIVNALEPSTPVDDPSAAEQPAATDLEVSAYDKDEIAEELQRILSDCTGYPAEMLSLHLNLEADLGIDSIKRVEMFGTLAKSRLGPLMKRSKLSLAELANQPSLNRIVDCLLATSEATDAKSMARMILLPEDCPLSGAAELSRIVLGGSVLIVVYREDDISVEMTRELAAKGQQAKVLSCERLMTATDEQTMESLPDALFRALESLGVVNEKVTSIVNLLGVTSPPNDLSLPQSTRDDQQVAVMFHLCKQFERRLRESAGRLISVSRLGGHFATAQDRVRREWSPSDGAVIGLVKTLSHEWPEVECRAVDFGFDDSPRVVAQAVAKEVLTGFHQVEVGYIDGKRKVLRPTPMELERGGVPFSLDEGAVVLATGGGRGITFEVVEELAQKWRPTLVLVGSSELPEAESALTAHCVEERELKNALIEDANRRGEKPTPVFIESQLRKVLRDREIRRNIEKLRSHAKDVRYINVDVRNSRDFAQVLQGVYRDFGRIDGVIHGAGTIEDKLFSDKSFVSWQRVYQTKVSGALTLARHLKHESLKFMVFFSSVSARYGNRGQSDYAAANEVLNKLAIHLSTRWQSRILSINWGPWAGTGMVSPELVRKFQTAGVPLIAPPWGRAMFMEELMYGGRLNVEVILDSVPGPDTNFGKQAAPEPLPRVSRRQAVV